MVCKREIERQLRNDALMSRVVTATSTVSASGPAVNTNRSSSDEKTNKQDKESIFSIASQILQRQGTAKLDLATKLEFYNEMQKIVTNMSILCQRHSTKSNTSYWFNTFDKLLAERRKSTDLLPFTVIYFSNIYCFPSEIGLQSWFVKVALQLLPTFCSYY